MCTAATLMHHTHAAETTLPLITAAATQRRSHSARDGHAYGSVHIGMTANYSQKP